MKINSLKIFLNLINKKQKIKIILIIFVMLLGACFEVVSLGALIPFIGVLAGGENELLKYLKYFSLERYHENFTRENITTLFCIIAIMAGFIRFFLLKIISDFNHDVGKTISQNVYNMYLYQDYETFKTVETSEKISALNKIDELISIVNFILNGVTSLIILTFIILLIINISPIQVILVILIMAAIFFLIASYSKNKLSINSKIINNCLDDRIKIIQDTSGLFKEIKIYQDEALYSKKFSLIDSRLRNSQAINQIISAGPRYIIEAFSISLIAILTYILTEQLGFAYALPILAIIALAAQKILPLAQQIYFAWTQYAGGMYIFEYLDKVCKSKSRVPMHGESFKFQNYIKLNNIIFKFQNDFILKNINLKINKGDVFGIIGRTGSGKSTFIDIITGLLHPSSGQLIIDDKIITKENASLWYSNIAIIPQDVYLFNGTILENIILNSTLDANRLNDVLLTAQLSNDINSGKLSLDTFVGERGNKISGGQRQRIGIARAIYKIAKLYILDESTSAIDLKTEEKLLESLFVFLRDETVVLISHRPEILTKCNKIYDLNVGLIKE